MAFILLLSLYPEYQLEIGRLHTVVYETIVTELLKTLREHGHEIPPDELGVFDLYLPFWITGS